MSYFCDSKESIGLARVGIFRIDWFLIDDFGFRNLVGLKIEVLLCHIKKCLLRFLGARRGHFFCERWIDPGIESRRHFFW